MSKGQSGVSSREERDAQVGTVDLLLAIRHASMGRGHRRSLLEATGMDLPGTERWILHAIPGGALVPVGQVADSLGIALPAVSRACTRLVDAGHLVRLPDPRDRRRILIGLSDHADAALGRWATQWPTGYLAATDGWTADELRAFDEWLRMVTAQVLHAATPGAVRTFDDSTAPHLRQFRTTIEAMVPAAGRFDLMASMPTDTTWQLTDGTFQALVLVTRSQGLMQSEIAAQTDTDPALTRRRVRSLLDLGMAQLLPSPTHPTQQHVSATPEGHSAVEEVLSAHADAMPDVPGRLIDAGLPELVRRYVAHLTDRTESQPAVAGPPPTELVGLARE